MDREKAGKWEFSEQLLKEEEEPGENPSTHICCTSFGSIPISWQLFNNEPTQWIASCKQKGKKQSRQEDPSLILPVIASSSPQINATMATVQITHTLATVHHPKFYPAQPGFLQWTLQVWQDHPEEGDACLVLMLEEKRECMNVQEEIQEQIFNSLRFLFPFIFSAYSQIAPHQIKNTVSKFNNDIAAFPRGYQECMPWPEVGGVGKGPRNTFLEVVFHAFLYTLR